ncbi:MAG: hypothetical protein GC168_18810 [Candidatus Hydrogenedens sp.]|nr:hypothetical protein [Candidatus Hydrogenedens sp.]
MRFAVRYLLLCTAVALAARASHAEEVQIIRDTYGVAHIYADTEAGAAYGTGYAQAEDRLEDIYANIRTAIGRAAEAFGEDHLRTDYGMMLTHNADICKEYYNKLPAELKAITDGYVAGVKAFEKDHPERRPDYALDIEPWHPLAIGRAMVLKWPLGTLMDDFGQRPEKPEFRSNSYAIAPKRTTDNCAIVLTDPHLSWESLAVFWEARVHAPDFHMNGFFIVGSPLVGLGHAEYCGWAMTTGGPDTSDVYMMKLNPDMPMQYEYDGEWKTAELIMYDIPVKGEDKPRQMPALYTMHGPLLGEPDFANHVAYAGKTPYMEDTGLFEQTYAMIKAKNADEFYAALKMNHLMEQNVTYGDRDGNIGYVRVGRTPIRPEGYDWSKPVPGWTSETEWKGIHDLDDHVRIVNPPQGYMQNCNISPANMMRNSPLKPEKFIDYLYNVSWDYNNPRGKRMTDLLAENDVVTKQRAMDIAMDVYCETSMNWRNALAAATQKHDGDHFQDPVFFDSLLAVTGWDATYRQDMRGPVLMQAWRMFAEGKLDTGKVSRGEELNAEEQQQLIAVFHDAMTQLKQQYGTTDLLWGDLHKVGRGGSYFPYDGADYGRGDNRCETVRDVECSEDPKNPGHYIADSGSMSAMLMFMHKDGIESYSCTQWGVSAVPDSPHHTDQAEQLYSKRKFKPTWNTKEALAEATTSTKTLTLP